MTDAKNFKCYERLTNRQLLQVSGLCGTPFFSYLPKRFTHIYTGSGRGGLDPESQANFR